MVIVFGNQKGGAGKTTLAMLFANFLSLVKKRDVLVIDMDYQRSIYSRYQEDKALDVPEPYEVLELDLDKYPQVYEGIKSNPDQIVVIDLPGKLDDNDMEPVLRTANVFIIPFHYDKNTFHSTSIFNVVTSKLNPDAKKFFIPNRVKANVRHEMEEEMKSGLSKYGTVTAKITDSVAIQRTTTREISPKVIPLVKEAFEIIIRGILS